MPHAGYSEDSEEEVYETLYMVIEVARSKQMTVMLAGEWNAQAGKHDETDETNAIGKEGFGMTNGRGETLKKWVTMQRLAITNTLQQEMSKNGHMKKLETEHRLIT